jgi:hypothetical protein
MSNMLRRLRASDGGRDDDVLREDETRRASADGAGALSHTTGGCRAG